MKCHLPQIPDQINLPSTVKRNGRVIWPGDCGKSPQLYAHHTVKVFVQFSYVGFAIFFCIPACACACVCVCVIVCMCVCVHTCLIHAVPFRALQLWFLSLYITFFLSFLCFVLSFSFPLSVLLLLFVCLFFFSFSLYLLAVLLALVPLPCPLLWHHGWLCPIRSAAGEGGEWDAGSSESGAGSHHTVLRPWNVSGTTTTNNKPRRVSLPPSLCRPTAITLKHACAWREQIQHKTISQNRIFVDKWLNSFGIDSLLHFCTSPLNPLGIMFCVELLLFRFRLGGEVVHQHHHC